MAIRRLVFFGTLCLLSGCAHSPAGPPAAPSASLDTFLSDAALGERILALNPERLSAEDVSSTLSACPAPRVLAFNGSAFNTMDSFSKFLIRMGYPESAVRDPATGALSQSGWRSAQKVTQDVSRILKTEKLRPMLIGHSRGGALVVQTLHELKGVRLGFAGALATGQWMRFMTGQWSTIPLLRKIPDSVEEFTGYRLAGDWLGSDVPLLKASGDYEAEGTAKVRNVLLRGTGHLEITRIEAMAGDPAMRRILDAYVPGTAPPGDARLFFAADIWYHVKKYWCLELQHLTRAHRSMPVHVE